jgi:hypothetical protein
MKKNLESLRSFRAAFRKPFWAVVTLALMAVPNLHAQVGGVSWGPSQAYDVGYNPSVASSGTGYMVEVHNGQNGAGRMWYHVGQATWNWPSSSPSVAWGPYQEYDWGYDPSVAGCVQSNMVVEVHNGQGSPGPMWYHVGSIQGDAPGSAFIYWGPAQEYDKGWNPKVALLCYYGQYTVIEVHNGLFGPGRNNSPMTMYYHVGVINPDLQSITWGPAYAYDIGWDPSVAAYGSTVVEVHNNAGATPGSMWYHVGLLTPNQTIAWGPPLQYDNGWEPKVAIIASNGEDDLAPLGSSPLVFEVHNGQGNFGPIWYHLGQLGNNLNINWGPPLQYDVGWDPSIAWLEMYSGGGFFLGAVEVHDGQAGFGWMWSHGDLWIPPGGFVVTGN